MMIWYYTVASNVKKLKEKLEKFSQKKLNKFALLQRKRVYP